MTTTPLATRRSFIRTAGTALSVPLAAAAAAAPVSAATGDPLQARLAHFEDLEAIRTLAREFAARVNAGAADAAALLADSSGATMNATIDRLVSDDAGGLERIEIAPDRERATAVLHCTVEIDVTIGPSCPLVEMARAQGGGMLRRTERGVLEQLYVRRGSIWQVERVVYRTAETV